LQVIFFLAVILGGLISAEVSYIFGWPVLTLGSDYFGIATLGFTIIMKVLLDNSDTLFGFTEMKGARGMVGIPGVSSWLWVSGFLLVVVIVTRNLLHSSAGRALISVREDEIAAKAMGIDVAQQKILTFVLGSFFAGIAGGLYAHINGFLHPNTFNFIKSFDPMIIIVFGGLGSVTGTVFAAFAWALVLEGFLRLWLPQGFETWRFVVYPVLLLIMMLLRPKGLFGGFEVPFLKQILPPLRKSDKSGGENLKPTSEVK
jgi:branched-chain amino acid transport system permease protein